MTRRLPIVGACLSIALGVVCQGAYAQAKPLRLFIETVEVTRESGHPSPPAPLLRADVLLLPVRLVLDRLGALITWDDQTDRLTAHLPDTKIVLTLGEPTVSVNDEDLEMGSPPTLVGGVMYLPDGVWRRVLPVDTRFLEEEGSVELTYRWEPRVVTVEQLAEYPRFFRARTVLVEGEYRGWRAKGLAGPVSQGPPARHRGAWIVADDTGGVYVSEREPEGLDGLRRPGPRIRVTGLAAVTETGAPYLRAERVEQL